MVPGMSNLRAYREKIGISQEKLAKLANTSQPQIQRLEKGERELTPSWADRLAPHLKTTAKELLFDTPQGVDNDENVTTRNDLLQKDLPNASIHAKDVEEGRLVPLYGQAVGGVYGEFVMNGTTLDYIPALPGMDIDGIYAVTVSGDSMIPRYDDADTCFVNSKLRPKRGNYVIAQIRESEEGPIFAYVKKLVRHTFEELVLEQFNPPKELRFDAKKVISVHVITGSRSQV